MLKACFLAILLFIFTIALQAQQKEQHILSKSDSILLEWKKKADSKISSFDSLSSKSFSKIDSAQKKISAEEKGITALNVNASATIDSLKPDLSLYQHKMEHIKGRLSHRIDSLNKLNLPTEKYSNLLDSLNKSGPVKDIKQAEAKLAALQLKANKPVSDLNQGASKLSNGINEKAKLFNGAGANLSAIPGLKSFSLNAPPLNTALPKPDLKLNQHQYQIPKLTPPSVSLKEIESFKFNDPIKGFSLKEPKLNIPGVDMKSIRGASAKVGEYSNALKDIRDDNMEHLSKEAEQEALKPVDLKVLQQNQAQITQYESQLAQLKDQDAMKGLAKQEIQKQATNHFAGKEQMLQQAMDKLSSYKKKYAELTSLKDTLKRPPNPMHGKPFKERIIPGFTMQFINSKDFTMDLNLSVAYRLSGKFNLGAGWVERIYVTNWQLSKGNPVYGVRNFGEFKWKNGFYFRAEAESINAMTPQLSSVAGPTDSGQRVWGWNVATGIKTDFQVFKSVRGNVQTLYRVWNSENQTPYPDRLIVRIGFEFPMKKKENRP